MLREMVAHTQATQQAHRDVMAQMQAVLSAQTATTQGTGARPHNRDVHKYFTRVDKLETGSQWREWHYQFRVAAKAFSEDMGMLLETVEKFDLQEVDTVKIQSKLSIGEEKIMDDYHGELYSVLSLMTKGEANQVVRGVADTNGYVAWKMLCDRFNPKTPASLTAAWREVIRPKRVKDLRDVGKAIDAWEQSITRLRAEHNDGPSEGLKAALLLEMIPDSVQLTVAQGMTMKNGYQALKERIKLMAAVQIDYCTPKPMDIGETEEKVVSGFRKHFEDQSEEVEAVGARKGKGPAYGSCWTCGGAHFQRECPKGWGKGLQEKGKGDGWSKGKGKGKEQGPMFGSCWTCGGAHFARDCMKGESGKGAGRSKGKGKSLREVDEWEDDYGEEVGSITEGWGICGIDDQRRPRRWMPGGRRNPRDYCVRETAMRMPVKNTFEALQEEDDDSLYIDQVDSEPDVDCEHCAVEEGSPKKGHDRDDINWVSEGRGYHVIGKSEIIVDSGAAESVCPWGWAEAFPVKEIPEGRKRDFRNASGDPMGHHGVRRVRCSVEGVSSPVNMLFQVSDARNPLASVARITEQGNIVQFGPEDRDNYIYNPDTKEKIQLRRKGRKFVVDVSFLASRPPFSGRA